MDIPPPASPGAAVAWPAAPRPHPEPPPRLDDFMVDEPTSQPLPADAAEQLALPSIGGTDATQEESPTPSLPLDEYPIDRIARIAASIARRREDEGAILEGQRLAAPTWELLRAHWLDAIRAETERGERALLRAYDEAYVAQLEAERGAIGIEEYTRLLIADERGVAERVLAELDLPQGALMRIQRVWADRMMDDPALGASVMTALEEAGQSGS
jgi:hypothetical protein